MMRYEQPNVLIESKAPSSYLVLMKSETLYKILNTFFQLG